MSTIAATRAMPSTLTDRQVAAYHRDGYLSGGPLLTPTEVEELRKELDRVIAERDRTDIPQPVSCMDMNRAGTPVWQIVNTWQASPAFERLIHHPRLVAMMRQLAGADGRVLRVWHDQVQYKPAHHGGVNWWHQDSPYWTTLSPRDSMVTAWIALDEVSLDNGCMSMVPGSHSWGDHIEHLHACGERSREFWTSLGDEFQDQPVRVVPRTVALGNVHFHHPLTWHGSHENRSDRPRRAIAVHAMTARTVFDEKGQHIMKKFITAKHGQPVTDSVFVEL
ncbi:MAG: phytanoyl-CoA dioxygenase family protein [Planctomycetota bacterium]